MHQMNSNLRHKISSILKQLADRQLKLQSSVLDPNNPAELVNYIANNDDGLGLREIWANIKEGIQQALKRSQKNAQRAKAAYSEAEFRLQQVMDRSHDESTKNRAELQEILKLIDEAIVHCPLEPAQMLAMMFALRSAALGEMKRHRQALVNIDLAIQLAPAELLYQAYKAKHLISANRHCEAAALIDQVLRKSSALKTDDQDQEMISQLLAIQADVAEHSTDETRKEQKDEENTEETSDESLGHWINEKSQVDGQNFDFASSIRVDSNTGHLVAQEDIAVDSLIFIEKSYSLILLPDALLSRCQHCARDVANVFWPCANCSSVVFCNEQCARQNSDHELECGLVNFWLDTSKSQFHVFRLLNRVGIEAALDIEKLPRDVNILLDYAHDDKQVHSIKAFKALLTLHHRSDRFDVACLPSHLINAIECAIITFQMHGFDYDSVPRERLVGLISHCFFGARRVQLNSFHWSDFNNRGDKIIMGVCLLPLASILNHSCDSNANWTICDGKLYLSTCKSVKVGSQITINYGVNRSSSFDERQKSTLQYFFQCKCYTCQVEARAALALQCASGSCPGPVVVNSSVYDDGSKDAPCLLCRQPLLGTKVKLDQLLKARRDLHTIVQLTSNLLGGDKEVEHSEKLRKSTRDLAELLEKIQACAYKQSYLLANDLFAACQVFHRAGLHEQCVQLGMIVDRIVPMKSNELLILSKATAPKNGLIYSSYECDHFDLNIGHMLFWFGILRQSLVGQTTSIDTATLFDAMGRFYSRAMKLINLALTEYRRRLAKLPVDKETFKSVGLREQIMLLESLSRHKERQYARTQEQFGALFTART